MATSQENLYVDSADRLKWSRTEILCEADRFCFPFLAVRPSVVLCTCRVARPCSIYARKMCESHSSLSRAWKLCCLSCFSARKQGRLGVKGAKEQANRCTYLYFAEHLVWAYTYKTAQYFFRTLNFFYLIIVKRIRRFFFSFIYFSSIVNFYPVSHYLTTFCFFSSSSCFFCPPSLLQQKGKKDNPVLCTKRS